MTTVVTVSPSAVPATRLATYRKEVAPVTEFVTDMNLAKNATDVINNRLVPAIRLVTRNRADSVTESNILKYPYRRSIMKKVDGIVAMRYSSEIELLSEGKAVARLEVISAREGLTAICGTNNEPLCVRGNLIAYDIYDEEACVADTPKSISVAREEGGRPIYFLITQVYLLTDRMDTDIVIAFGAKEILEVSD